MDYYCEDTFDKTFEEYEHLNFFPYIGKKYNKAYPKIMLLGESHYTDKDATDDDIEEQNNDTHRTREVFENYFMNMRPNNTHPDNWIKCYRNCAAMIAGHGYHESDYIWEYLAYYVFFQEIVGKYSKGKKLITNELIKKSQNACFDMINNILKPNLVIAWGVDKLLHQWMPSEDRVTINDNLYYYKNNPQIKIWHIKHPSRGFSYKEWHKKFIAVINELDFSISEMVKKE
jgi:hypothetical protein